MYHGRSNNSCEKADAVNVCLSVIQTQHFLQLLPNKSPPGKNKQMVADYREATAELTKK